MGASYTTHTLHGAPGRDVLEFMLRRGKAAFVSSGLDGYTVVLDADSDWQGPWVFQLAKDLSIQLACPVLAVIVHDDDVTCYELWNAGEHHDAYDSTPGFADPTKGGSPEGGNAAELVRLMGREGSDPGAIERVLQAAHGTDEPTAYLFEHKRHAELVSLLGLPDYAAGFGYRYLAASISAGQPLSNEFQSNGVPHEVPKPDLSNVSTVNEDDADIVVEVTRGGTALRLRGLDDPIPGEPDLGAQLRAMQHVSASALILLRFSTDLPFERAGEVLASLQRAGIGRIIFGSAAKQ